MAEKLAFAPPPTNNALSLPVALSDGTERVYVGTLSVPPSIGFRKLQLEISRMVGVPPYQMLSFLERPTTSHRNRIPIDERIDLGVVSREVGEWQILAVVRRTRNGRNRRGRRTKGGTKGFAEDRKPQPEKIILRRNDATNAPAVYDLMYGPVAMMPMWGHLYQTRICDAQNQSDGYDFFRRDTWQASERAEAVCAVCEAASYLGVDAAFHCCARDEIVEVGSYVRSAVGPIERPSGKRVAGCA